MTPKEMSHYVPVLWEQVRELEAENVALRANTSASVVRRLVEQGALRGPETPAEGQEVLASEEDAARQANEELADLIARAGVPGMSDQGKIDLLADWLRSMPWWDEVYAVLSYDLMAERWDDFSKDDPQSWPAYVHEWLRERTTKLEAELHALQLSHRIKTENLEETEKELELAEHILMNKAGYD